MASYLIPIMAALAASLGAYGAAARRMSGKISNSTASDLWAESSAIREYTRQQLTISDGRVRELEVRVATLEHENSSLSRLNHDLHDQVDSCQSACAKLQGVIDTLNDRLRGLE